MLELTQLNIKNSTYDKRKIILIVGFVVIIALMILLAGSLLLKGQNPSSNPTGIQTNPQSWIKTGSYATYDGQVSILSMEVSFQAKMEIVNLNNTHIKISTDFNMSTPYGTTENSTTIWVSRERMDFQPEGMTLNSTYNAELALAKLGTRNCTVYEYCNDEIAATYYIDNHVQWPVKIVMTSPITIDGQSYHMEINLVDSNIPGL